MRYFKLGWNWIQLAITQQFEIQIYRCRPSRPAPNPLLPQTGNKMMLLSATSLSALASQLLNFVPQAGAGTSVAGVASTWSNAIFEITSGR